MKSFLVLSAFIVSALSAPTDIRKPTEEQLEIIDQEVASPVVAKQVGLDDWSLPTKVQEDQFFVPVESNMFDTLRELDRRMKAANIGSLISSKSPHSIFGRVVESGKIGIYEYKGRPKIVLDAGNYWNFNPAISWITSADVTTAFSYLSLTVAQVGQQNAMVVLDPRDKVFVVRNGGFAAFGIHGSYRVLATVDTTNLGPNSVDKDKYSGAYLGQKMAIKNGGYDVATFLNIPANNVAVVQNGDHMFLLKGGQHVITNPTTTFRQFFTLGESQMIFTTAPTYPLENVPVVLKVNLRYRLIDPLLLAANYLHPIDALQNPVQSVVNRVIAKMSYKEFMRASSVVKGEKDGINYNLVKFQEECLEELKAYAELIGVQVRSFDIQERSLHGDLGRDLEKQAEQVIKNEMEANQVALRNEIITKEQIGKKQVAQIANEQSKMIADTEYYTKQRQAEANYYACLKDAQAKAEASKLTAEQEAKNKQILAEAEAMCIKLRAGAYANTDNEHARKIQLGEQEIEKFDKMKANWVLYGQPNPETGGIQNGYNAALGVALGSRAARN